MNNNTRGIIRKKDEDMKKVGILKMPHKNRNNKNTKFLVLGKLIPRTFLFLNTYLI